MKNQIKIVQFILIISLFFSCKSNNSAHFSITNDSPNTIDSLRISSSGSDYTNKVVVKNVLPKSNSTIELNMNDVPKFDGNYFIEVFVKESKREKAFGYYTNGTPTNSTYILSITKDSIIVSERMQ